MSCESCVCEENTCPATLYSVDVNEVYNVSLKGESLKLLNVTIHNESLSYSFHILAYLVEEQQYNLSVMTRIMPINDTNLFTTIVNIDPRDDKAKPVADVVFFTNETTLADHYRLLGKVLSEIRKNDETSWIWNKVRLELNELAKKVERDLEGYNVEGFGIAAIADGVTICIVPLTPLIELRLECRTNPSPPTWMAIITCCGVFYGTLLGCTAACLGGQVTACVGCLAGPGAVFSACSSVCPQMDLCAYTLGTVKIGCWGLW